MRTPFVLLVLLLSQSLASNPAQAQLPSAPWRTATTENFRIHYPEPWEPWALRLGGRLESILEVVSGEVGYRLDDPIDVVIADPESQSNGSAWPLLDGPRTVFWTRPPEANSILGHATDWGELLAIHEIAHLVHLGRPSRNPRRAVLERVAPIGAITRKAPRWIFEGYATLVEGRLTGSGRPYGDQRAALIRRFALEGRLPTYPGLASDSQSFLGMSMAYLVGSAYLEWLEARVEPGSLPRLWRRLTARVDRSFDDAFRGVYGAPPAELYGRFVAEVTAKALDAERQLVAVGREGEVWLDLDWFTGSPAVSPDGTKIVALRRSRETPAKLVVWQLGEDADAIARRATQLAEMLERDGEDVAPLASALPPLRKTVAELEGSPARPVASGRWTADSQRVLFTGFGRGRDGQRHGDLFLWSVESGQVDQLTFGADLSDADPAHTGNWAVAVRSRFGGTGLVRVDLSTGAEEELLALSIDRVVDRPRLSPTGDAVAFLEQREGRWRLVIMNVNRRSWGEFEVPRDGRIMEIAWSATGEHIYAVVGRDGMVDIEALAVGLVDPEAPPKWHQVTRSRGPVAGPAPTPDGTELYYLALDPKGWDLRRLALDAATEQLPEFALDPALAPVARPAAVAAPVLASGTIEPGKPYGWGRPEWQALTGGFATNDGGPFELGVRGGDLLERWSLLALGSVGDSLGPRGAAVAAESRRWPVAFGVHLYDLDIQPSQGELVDRVDLDVESRGVEVRAGWSTDRGGSRLAIAGGVLVDEVNGAVERERRLGFAEVEVGARLGRGRWRLEPELGLAVTESLGGDEGSAWSRSRLGVGIGHGRHRAYLEWERRESRDDAAAPFELVSVGGPASSLVPRALEIGWGVNPALPHGALVGERIDSQRLRLAPAFLPVALLAERHRVDDEEWVELAGLEWQLDLAAMPLLRLPALQARIGAAQILDGAFEDETRWWAGLVVRK